MLTLIRDVLDFSKIEADKRPIEYTAPFPCAHWPQVVQPRALTAPKKPAVLVGIVPQVPDPIQGDPKHMRQELASLLGNAIKFTRKAKGTASASCTVCPSPLRRLTWRPS